MFFNQSKAEDSFRKDKASDKPLRSIAKTISWRFVGTIDTICISWYLTGKPQTAFAIGAVELVTKMVLYFWHERLWNVINFAKD
ncbi:DUF2061 domain-containing protein [Christiangramia salexigens]|uniref:DUF2061 domain-containing protein n=1 Tax=Christiangramia salexigens TaxID=1913577 RepID=A0A1L3J594_9FLAO|nr:DUF2061 domain-containing protein [Christiangramia salexigens]APG60283.1 hypothetical protein LPB144_07625 [Christiangramia salexigens]